LLVFLDTVYYYRWRWAPRCFCPIRCLCCSLQRICRRLQSSFRSLVSVITYHRTSASQSQHSTQL